MAEGIIAVCGKCGTKNRIPADRLGDNPKCARCHAGLAPAGAHKGPLEVTDAIFESEVLRSAMPVLVDFWASWCGPCRMVGPVLEQIAVQYNGRLKVVKVNVDQNPVVAGRYQIRSIPTMMVFSGGTMRHVLTGALPKQEIERQISPFI